ncbi:Ig-like domain repeat protein [Methanobrevibacter sp.]
MKSKIFIASALLILIALLGTASAADGLNETNNALSENPVDENILQQSNQPEIMDNQTQTVNTQLASDDATVVKGNELSVKLTDDNGTGIANKSITVEFNKKSSSIKTDDDGIAKFKVNAEAGKYTIKYTFKEEGYSQSTISKEILVISTTTSKIKGSDYTAYLGAANKFTVLLTVGGMPIEGRTVTFKVNGKTITKKTHANGKATLNIKNLAKGTYKITYSYDGESNIKSSSSTSKITVKTGVPIKISKYAAKIYRNKKSGKFKVKIVDVRGKALANKKVTFKFNKKTYTKRTDKNGIATVTIKLKTGSYKVKVSCAKTKTYNKATKTYKIKVKPKQCRNNGMWLLSSDMKKVNFDKLKKYGFKHIFLNAKALERFGKSYVESWIKQAKKHGIKVHLWMQVFYKSDKWSNPIKNGKINTKLINSRVKEAKKLANVKGVAGVHFDYVRYPGNAYNYNGAVKAVNTFVKKATKAVHKVNKKIIVSAAVMPEPSSMKKYYAQDIPTMGKYLDAIIPMVYKGNYHAGSKWITWVTKTFAKQSKKAKIWTGLQTYKSDESLKKLSAKELMGDADASAMGGAYGVILFRYGLFNYINFNEV